MDSKPISTISEGSPLEDRERRGPSRVDCEKAIRRILMTETLENGKNLHFKSSSDFMSYFESLYPASPGLKKQIQRAIHEMDMAKDPDGFYIVGKTKANARDEEDLSSLMKTSGAVIADNGTDAPLETVFIEIDPDERYRIPYIAERLSRLEYLSGKFTTLMPCTNGIMFFTSQKEALKLRLSALL